MAVQPLTKEAMTSPMSWNGMLGCLAELFGDGRVRERIERMAHNTNEEVPDGVTLFRWERGSSTIDPSVDYAVGIMPERVFLAIADEYGVRVKYFRQWDSEKDLGVGGAEWANKVAGLAEENIFCEIDRDGKRLTGRVLQEVLGELGLTPPGQNDLGTNASDLLKRSNLPRQT